MAKRASRKAGKTDTDANQSRQPTHTRPDDDALPDPRDRKAIQHWLEAKPREWSVVIAARTALRVVPFLRWRRELGQRNAAAIVLPIFRATAIARFAAVYPNRAIAAASYADAASYAASPYADDASFYAAAASSYAAAASYADAADAASYVASYADAAASSYADAASAAFLEDAHRLVTGTPPVRLAPAPLWRLRDASQHSPPGAEQIWSKLRGDLLRLGDHWHVWTDWYEEVLAGSPPLPARSEAWEAAFTDIPSPLPWDEGPEAVNLKIRKRLDALVAREAQERATKEGVGAESPDLSPLEGVSSPIAIMQRPDGRIGADAGMFALPELPPLITREDLAQILAACRSRAEKLLSETTAPTFNGRPDYAIAIAAYLEWLPATPETGNILLADGEARVLNKLFTADERVLATGFATRLSVFLEDHIGLRSYYEEVERHYQAVRTGRLATPIQRDAVEGIKQTVHDHTPEVFDESVAPVVDETAKPVPEPAPLPPEDRPPPDPNRPKPPRDPIADPDPQKSRSYIFAAAANRIWELLVKGKDASAGLDGWRKAYEQMRPHMEPIIAWLRTFNGS